MGEASRKKGRGFLSKLRGSKSVPSAQALHPEIPQWILETCDYAAKVLGPAKQYQAAITMTLRAVRDIPWAYQAWGNLGNFFWNLQRFPEALEVCNRAIAIKADYAVALNTRGLVHEGMGNFLEAEKDFHAALACEKVPKDRVSIHWNLALLWLRQGQWKKGFEAFEYRVQRKPEIFGQYWVKPIWSNHDLKDKKVLVLTEQGLGDTIFFARYLPKLATMCDGIYFCADDKLTNLLWGYRKYGINFVPPGIPIESLDVDYIVYSCSLAHICGPLAEDGSFPFDYSALHERLAVQGDKVSLPDLKETGIKDQLRVGIVWTGNPEFEHNDDRSVPLAQLFQFATHPQVTLHSFQCGEASAELAKLGANTFIADLSRDLMRVGLCGTAIALQSMDLVITTCTMVAHLAGALGVPCWILLHDDPFWLWQSGTDTSPWYPSVRLYRQKTPKDWGSVISQANDDLLALIRKRNEARSVETTPHSIGA